MKYLFLFLLFAASPTFAATLCAPGSGHDYIVGSTQYPAVESVPWEALAPGDTVRFPYRATPYVGKFAINTRGTATAPIRVCGVKGPNGERPIVSGVEAHTRSTMSYGRSSAAPVNESRSVVMIVSTSAEETLNHPGYIQIDGLKFTGAHPSYGYFDHAGVHQMYSSFDACVWLERGWNVTIADNEITDCGQAIFSRSIDQTPQSQTQNISILGNRMTNNGIVGADGSHTTYLQSFGILVEGNYYGPMRVGSAGNAMKDRSVGLVARYNRIEAGSFAFDLVEAEDTPISAQADPRYRTTYVYGNQIVTSSALGLHYGGDHEGSESNYRKGTLYFWNNSIWFNHGTEGAAWMFRLSTTDEHAEVWNNVFWYDTAIQYAALRTKQDVATGYTAGGIVNLGKNWIVPRWTDGDPVHPPIPGQLNGTANLITTGGNPLTLSTLVPVAAAVGSAQAQEAAVAAYPVNQQWTSAGLSARSSVSDIGAVAATGSVTPPPPPTQPDIRCTNWTQVPPVTTTRPAPKVPVICHAPYTVQ